MPSLVQTDGRLASIESARWKSRMAPSISPACCCASPTSAQMRARIWAEVGDAQQQAGDIEGAIRDFQRALSMDASLPSVWTKLGIAYKDRDCKGCRTKAVDALQRATRVDPGDALAHHELGYMFKDDGRRREAIAEFRKYLDLRPDAGDASSVRDDIYYLQEESRRIP